MRLIARFVTLLLLLATVPIAVWAQTAATSSEPTFTIDELLKQALERNPDVLAAQKKYEAAKARPSQESSLPDPVASFAYQNMGNPIPFTTLDNQFMSNAGFDVAQELPFPGKLKLKAQGAAQEAKAVFQDYESARLRVVSRLKQDYYQLHYVYRAEEILNRNKDLLDRFARIAESRYSVGRAQQADVFRAQVEISVLIRQMRKIEQEKQTLKADINTVLNRLPEAPLGRPADYAKAELKPTFADLLARAEQSSPMLRREQALIEKSQTGLELARRDYYPDFGVMAGWRTVGAGMGSMYEARFDVKVPLYFWRKQRAAVQEQAANVSAARHQYRAAGQSVAYMLKEAYEAAQTSDELLTLYSKGILPQSTLALESSLSSYQVGTLDFLTLLTSFRTVLDYEMSYYEELASFQKALARLEELTGASLT